MQENFQRAQKIIDAINRKDKKALECVLSSLTGWELMLFFKSGYKFLLVDVLKVLELPDADNKLLHTVAESNGNEDHRPV